MKNLFLFLSLTLFLTACQNKTSEKFNVLTKTYFDEKNALNPLDATQNGQSQYDADLVFEMTDSFRKKQGEFFDKYQSELKKIDTTKLGVEQKNSYQIIAWETQVGKELLAQPTNLMPVQQFWGPHLTMAQYAGGTSAQPFKTEKNYLDFAIRMEKYSAWIDSAMVYMKKGVDQKVVLPKALVEKLIPQFDEMEKQSLSDNVFFSAIKTMPADFSDKAKTDIKDKYTVLINQKIVPQYKKMATFLKTEYLPASRSTSGIGAFPFGKDLYKVYLKQWTTTEKTPEEIHKLGLEEVELLKAEMEKVKVQVGFKGTLKEFMNDTRNNPILMPYKTPEEVLAHFEKIHQTIMPNINKLFSLQPKTKFEIRRTEAFREKTASAEYLQGAVDGSRPGIFYVPIPDATKYNVLEDEDLFLHEAIPGHHFQMSLQQENTSLPDFRRFNWFGAYGEGWALYAESLGKELGLYKDPYQYLGMLNDEMHRAIRLVVDTGIHSQGWTREQAIQYSLDNEAESVASITSEIERYMAIPGQACSYKIGQLKILELREKAKQKMGNKFDIKVFHQKVLESGVMPIEMLENKINAWINQK